MAVRENITGSNIGHLLLLRNAHNLIGNFDFSVLPLKLHLYIFDHFKSIEQTFANCIYINWKRRFQST